MISIFKNPELKRSSWLELSQQRLIVLPIISALIYLFIYVINQNSHMFAVRANYTALWLTGFILFLWGTRNAADSVIGEFNDRTWDLQRMTSMQPWDMAIGKLFGSTIYNWYGGAINLAVYFLTCSEMPNPREAFETGLLLILIAVFAHALSISISLFGVRKNEGRSKIASGFYTVIAILLSLNLMSFAFPGLRFISSGMEWYGTRYDYFHFAICSALFFVPWAVYGLYRMMRSELQIVNGPWAWILFLISLMIYSAGMIPSFKIPNEVLHGRFMQDQFHFSVDSNLLRLFSAITTCIYFAYGLVIIDRKNLIDFKRISKYFADRNFKKLGEVIPLWMLTLILLIPILLFTIFYALIAGVQLHILFFKLDTANTIIWLISILAFVIRDMSLFLFVNFGKRNRNADLAAVMYLAILYILFPAILMTAHNESLTAFFLPLPTTYATISLISGAIQAGFMFWFLRTRMKESWGGMDFK